MKRAGIVGWPVAHSLSPILHGYWLNHYGIDGVYERQAIAPNELTREKLEWLRDEKQWTGLNVTVPHKEAAFGVADNKDLPSIITGASNLLSFMPDKRISAQNTDWIGLSKSLQEALGDGALGGKSVVVLGAGGAARGVVYGLIEMGAVVHVLNRNPERANNLIHQIQSHKPGSLLHSDDWNNWPGQAQNAALIVNTTSGGMKGQPALDLDLSTLPSNAAVCDIVYSPLQTPLLRDAAARGHQTIDGLGMLMHQAVPSFETFFGKKPEVTPGLRAVLVEALNAR